MSLLSWWSDRNNRPRNVSENEPLPVQVIGPVAATGLTVTRTFELPGQTAAAYAAGDAIGTLFEVPSVTRDGVRTAILHSAILYDRSDQGVAVNVVLYGEKPVGTVADNAAFGVSDADLLKAVGGLTFSTFQDFSGNQLATLSGLGLAFETVGTSLYGQAVATGALTTAAGALFWLRLVFLVD